MPNLTSNDPLGDNQNAWASTKVLPTSGVSWLVKLCVRSHSVAALVL